MTSKKRPTLRFLRAHPLHWIALGLGSGLFSWMPGTVGALLGWLSFVLLERILAPAHWIALIIAGFGIGVIACGAAARALGVHDPAAANWDEVVAFWLVLFFVMPASFAMQCAAFALFRLFDIVKPPPIRFFERRFTGGFGIMFDDLIAAFYTLFVMAFWKSIHLRVFEEYKSCPRSALACSASRPCTKTGAVNARHGRIMHRRRSRRRHHRHSRRRYCACACRRRVLCMEQPMADFRRNATLQRQSLPSPQPSRRICAQRAA